MPGATVLRGAVLPERIPTDGLLILRDGDPGSPEVMLSPLQYHYEHRAEVEVTVQGKTGKGLRGITNLARRIGNRGNAERLCVHMGAGTGVSIPANSLD